MEKLKFSLFEEKKDKTFFYHDDVLMIQIFKETSFLSYFGICHPNHSLGVIFRDN